MIEFDVCPSSHPLPEEQRQEILAAPKFGQVFTDHMVTLRWSTESGWHGGRVEEFHPLTLHPSSSVLHYGQEIFEGMKAYRQETGQIALFRPEMNASRFNASARRLAMPELAEETFVQALELLVEQDRDWVPHGDGNSLYLRPFMIATQPTLGFTLPSQSYLFCVIACPVPPYFNTVQQASALTVWLSKDYTRAAPGGTGAAKAGGNYAAAFLAQRQAVEQGCDQVVWLDAAEHVWVEEMGGMNLCFVTQPDTMAADDRAVLMTPELTGTLLPGVTRDSLLKLASRLGMESREGRISVDEWRKQCEAGLLTEAFACGTAAVIAPIGKVRGADGEWLVGDGAPGPVTRRIRDELLGIQYGRRADPFGWVHKVC